MHQTVTKQPPPARALHWWQRPVLFVICMPLAPAAVFLGSLLHGPAALGFRVVFVLSVIGLVVAKPPGRDRDQAGNTRSRVTS